MGDVFEYDVIGCDVMSCDVITCDVIPKFPAICEEVVIMSIIVALVKLSPSFVELWSSRLFKLTFLLLVDVAVIEVVSIVDVVAFSVPLIETETDIVDFDVFPLGDTLEESLFLT